MKLKSEKAYKITKDTRESSRLQSWDESASMFFLILDISDYGISRNTSDRLAEIRTRPQSRQFAFKGRKSISKYSGSTSFHLLHNIVWRISRNTFAEYMHVVGHHLDRLNAHPDFSSLFKAKVFKGLFNISNKHFSPIFCTPNQVIANIVDASGICDISVNHRHNSAYLSCI